MTESCVFTMLVSISLLSVFQAGLYVSLGANSLNPMQRLRNHSRGFRSQEKVNQRKHKAKTNQRIARTRTREYRTSTPLETRHSLARCVSNYLYDDDYRAFKDSYNQRNSKDRHYMGHKRILLNICFGQDIEDKHKIAPREQTKMGICR